MPGDDAPLADDLIFGAKAFAIEIFGNDEPESVRKSFYLLERKHVPAEKIGAQWVGSRRRIRRRLQGEDAH